MIPPLYGALSSVSAGRASPAPQRLVSLAFAIHWQAQSEWCWAAVAESVGAFYASSPPCQCELASGPLGMDCCTLVNKAAGNKAESLTRALQLVGHLGQVLTRQPTFAEVDAELTTGNPLAARFLWSTGTAHFVAIGGCELDSSGVEWIEIDDPLFGYTRSPLSSLQTTYRNNPLQWTHTYLTVP